MAPEYLTSAEAAADLGIDRGTLTRWVKSGKIRPAFERPGSGQPAIRLFTPAEVARVKKARAAQSTPD